LHGNALRARMFIERAQRARFAKNADEIRIFCNRRTNARACLRKLKRTHARYIFFAGAGKTRLRAW
jgi:hypothetical protein